MHQQFRHLLETINKFPKAKGNNSLCFLMVTHFIDRQVLLEMANKCLAGEWHG